MKPIWLGVDWGQRRVGLAISDPTGTIASPFQVLEVHGDGAAIRGILGLLEANRVDRLIVGLPLSLNGSESPQTLKARRFAEKLSSKTRVPVFFVDERLSSRQAERDLIEMGVRREKRRETVDAVAASLLLQSALNGAILTPVTVSGGSAQTEGTDVETP
jgi:putative Holliday junction resolvase